MRVFQMDQVELKNKIEAILFASGGKVEVDRISNLCKADAKEVLEMLNLLKNDYETKNSPLMVVEEGSAWKLTVREKYLPLVQKIMPELELGKSILETLAIIAWKQPLLQSDLIKARTNKAYDHISQLEESGFITKEKSGRTYIIKGTKKLYDYFDVPDKKSMRDRLKAELKDIGEMPLSAEENPGQENKESNGAESSPEKGATEENQDINTELDSESQEEPKNEAEIAEEESEPDLPDAQEIKKEEKE